ncbi:MAG: hypothetical protein WC712_04135 [Candidatus Brocadiia bacterium]
MFWQRQFPLVVCFVLGVSFIIQFFVKHPVIQSDVINEAANFATIIGIFALVLGLYSITRMHWMKIRHRRKDWFFSYVLFASLLLMTLLGWILGVGNDTPFQWMYMAVMVPLSSTMFSLLAFYMASASFRAFRAKSFESTLLLLAAIVVMLGRVDIGPYMFPDTSIGNMPIWGVDEITNWLLEIPNTAASRGIGLGIALGTLATSLKMILGIERSYLG